ncbi:biotin synthase [Streptomyces sp. SPB074]|nr:biotin synthase [Streptomyces sp. SPB074]
MNLLNALVGKGLRCEPRTRAEALAVLATSDDDLLDVVAAAGRVRRHWFGRRVKLNYLVNLKSGLCPEDCSYCSQRLGSTADILKYTWLKPEDASKAAAAGVAGGAKRVCLVASGRGPTDRDVERVAAPSRRSRTGTRAWRCAPASVCSPTVRPTGCAKRARTPTTTTSTPPSRCTGTSRRPTRTPIASPPCVRRTRPGCPPVAVSSRAWARATRTWSTSSSRCAHSTPTRCR